MARDFYTVLGVSRDASDKDVRQAYRRLARKYHPDVNKKDKDATEKFKEVNAAYEVLSDPEKRKKYDQFGDNWKHADQFNRAGGGAGRGQYTWRTSGGAPPYDVGDLGFGTLFEDMLLGGRGRRGSRTVIQDTPVEVTAELSLEEAYAGTTRIIQIPAQVGGRERRLEVKIPAGVETGSRIHVPAGSGVDIYVVVTVQPHRRFNRKGADLYLDLQVPLVDAVLGGEQQVQTMKGQVVLTIPPESQNGQVFRLRNQGMPRLGDGASKGDLYVTLSVVLPTNLTEKEQQLFKELAHSRGERNGNA